MEAYQAVLERCNTEWAPWHVIPADHKWYRNWAVAQLLVEHLEALDLQWPAADYEWNRKRGGSLPVKALCADYREMAYRRSPLISRLDFMKINEVHCGDHVPD